MSNDGWKKIYQDAWWNNKNLYICFLDRGVEQLVARWAHNPKVGGSSPPPLLKEDETMSSFMLLSNNETALLCFGY